MLATAENIRLRDCSGKNDTFRLRVTRSNRHVTSRFLCHGNVDVDLVCGSWNRRCFDVNLAKIVGFVDALARQFDSLVVVPPAFHLPNFLADHFVARFCISRDVDPPDIHSLAWINENGKRDLAFFLVKLRGRIDVRKRIAFC